MRFTYHSSYAIIEKAKHIPKSAVSDSAAQSGRDLTMGNINSAGIALGTGFAFFFTVSVLLFVIFTIANWKIFSKAGEEGWQSLIPIWRLIVLYRIVYGNPWKALLLLIPVIHVIFYAGLMYRLALVYGRSRTFGVLMIFFPEILTLILGFSECEYMGADENSFI